MSGESENHWVSADAREAFIHADTTINRKIRTAWTGFLNFALRDNVLEVAVGLMYVFRSLSSLFRLVFRDDSDYLQLHTFFYI